MLPELDTGVIICQTIWVSEQWEKKVGLSISFLWHPTCSFMTYFLPGVFLVKLRSQRPLFILAHFIHLDSLVRSSFLSQRRATVTK